MQAMAWWLIPITATLLAVAWVTWTARPRKPADPHHTLAAHRRFTQALQPESDSPAASVRSARADVSDVPETEHRRSA
ncbi:MAG TPA: hypothetical protein VFX15_01980 [Actinomycetes bacterium]|nr:hypothetical protein [Actinomycetes bacterium]